MIFRYLFLALLLLSCQVTGAEVDSDELLSTVKAALSSSNDSGPKARNQTAQTADDFFKMPQLKKAKISPTGESIVIHQSDGRLSSLVLISTENYKRYLLLKDTFNDAISILDYHWIDDSTVVVETYIKGKGSALLAINLTFTGAALSGIENKLLVIADVFMVNELPKSKNQFIVGQYSEGKTSLYRIDASETNIKAQLQTRLRLNKKGPKATHWLTDANGQVILGYGLDKADKKNKVWVKNRKYKRWKNVFEGDEKRVFHPVLLSDDRKSLYVISNEKDDYQALYLYDLENQRYLKKVYEVKNADIDNAIVSIDNGKVLGVSYTQNGFSQTDYFSELEQKYATELALSLNESIPYVVDYNLAKDILIVQTSSSTDPGTYHLFKAKSWELLQFASRAPWLKNYPLGVNQIIKSTSIDGQQVESYLTLPTVKSDTLPPLIVLPHGGPISVRDDRHYDAHVQFLAALGYAVLQPNYRGSSGFGQTFEKQGMQQWGRLIEDDIESAVKVVKAKRLINKDKICIYGISYGGYSALINAINRPELYKCAASYAGVTDLPLLFNNAKLYESDRSQNMLKQIVGNPDTELDLLMQFSPVYQASRLNIPVFLAQGDKDTIVDIEHYERMKKVLQFHDKTAEYLVLEGEAHGFKYLSRIIEFYVALDKFFREALDLPPQGVVAVE